MGVNLDGVGYGCHAFGRRMVEPRARPRRQRRLRRRLHHEPQHGRLLRFEGGRGRALALPASRLGRGRRRRQRDLPRRDQHADPGATRAWSGAMAERQERIAEARFASGTRRTSSPRRSSGPSRRTRTSSRSGSRPSSATACCRSSPGRSRRWSAKTPIGRLISMRAEHHRVVVIGAGFAGVGIGVRLLPGGHRRLRDLRAQRVGRRHLVRAHLSGLRLRHPDPPLLVLVRAQPGLDAAVPEAGRDPRLRAGDRRRARRHAAHPLRLRDGALRAGTRPRAAGASRPRAASSPATSSSRAIGATAEPDEPEIPGLEDFEGHRFHSARWDWDHDLAGERVAVIGTGPGGGAVRARDPARGRGSSRSSSARRRG